MRFTRSLLSIASALALAGGAAFAQDPMEPQYPMNSSDMGSSAMEQEREMSAEPDVYIIYPVEVTEYYILVPSVDTEMPQG